MLLINLAFSADVSGGNYGFDEHYYNVFPSSSYLKNEDLEILTNEQLIDRQKLYKGKIDSFTFNLYEHLKLFQRKSINKETLRVIVYKVLVSRMDVDEIQLKMYWAKIVDVIYRNAPNTINVEEISEYIEGKYFNYAIEHMVEQSHKDDL